MSSNEIDLSQILDGLQIKAEEDGKVSFAEAEFLGTLRNEVEKYQIAVNEAQQDNVISEDEFQDLVLLRDNVLTTAMDFDSDSDEINLLVKELFEEINKHKIPGMTDDELIDSDIEPAD